MVVILKCFSLPWTDTFISFFPTLNRHNFTKCWVKTWDFELNQCSIYSHLCCCSENATEMKFSPRSCVDILNNTFLGSKENVALYDTFPSSYVISLAVTEAAFHRHLPLILVCCFFASSEWFASSRRFLCGIVIKILLKSTLILFTLSCFICPIYHCAVKTFQVELCQCLFLRFYFFLHPVTQ